MRRAHRRGLDAASIEESDLVASARIFVVVYPGIATQGGARICANRPTLDRRRRRAAVAGRVPVRRPRRRPSRAPALRSSRGDRELGRPPSWESAPTSPRVRSWDVRTRRLLRPGRRCGRPRRICLLGTTVADALFEAEDPARAGSCVIKNVPLREYPGRPRRQGQQPDRPGPGRRRPRSRTRPSCGFLKGASKIDFFRRPTRRRPPNLGRAGRRRAARSTRSCGRRPAHPPGPGFRLPHPVPEGDRVRPPTRPRRRSRLLLGAGRLDLAPGRASIGVVNIMLRLGRASAPTRSASGSRSARGGATSSRNSWSRPSRSRSAAG